MAKKHVFIVGLDDFNLQKLQQLPQADECEFHPALSYEDIRGVESFDIDSLIEKAITTIENHSGTVDGVASFYDFPGTSLIPILAKRFGLPGPTLEAVLKCENKYWSRLEQSKVVPKNIPQFQAFDPRNEDAYEQLRLLPPFWIKPLKAFRSFLAFQINDVRQFHEVMPICREKGSYIGKPFMHLMQSYGMPEEIANMPETFLAESPIGGSQCTLEGYVYDGQVVVYGVVDSIREQDRSSFGRYEYPSALPLEVQHRMIDVVRMAVRQMGLSNSPFNAEFFYDQSSDHVWLLEINPRISQSHADLFQKVHGISHHGVMTELALGRKPKTMECNGAFEVAGHFMLRTFRNGRVVRVPTQAALEKLRRLQPETIVRIVVESGQHLGSLKHQDMYSFELASVFIGGRDRRDLLDKYHQALTALQFDIEEETQYQFSDKRNPK